MRVRLRRPLRGRRARVLLAAALLIPAAGFFQAAGVNPLSITAALLLGAGALALLVDAVRPVLTVSRSGLVVRRLIGAGDQVLPWREITQLEVVDEVISVTTRDQSVYQIELTARTAAFVGRIHHRALAAR